MNSLPLSPQTAANELIRRRAGRSKLIDFVKFTKPDYIVDWVHEVLADKLDQFLADVLAKKNPRLMVFMPPRHGKSELASRRFPAFALGKNPNLTFIATSYAADLAVSISRDVQRVIDTKAYKNLFPGTTLNNRNAVTTGPYKRTGEEFEIVGHSGAYKCAGVGGGITGRGGDILLIDDPVKDFAEANSETYREATWNWYTSTLRTRAAPGAGIIVIQTRWHEDDLSGRLLKEQKNVGERWEIVNFPAVAEKKEQFRGVGDPLSPQRFNLDSLKSLEQSVGSYVWAALYQQRPYALGGGMIKGEWFGRFEVAPKILWRSIFADTAQKTKEHNDFSVFQCWGLGDDGKLYLLDQRRGKWEAPELKRTALEFWNKHHSKSEFGALRHFYIEDKSSGTGLIQDIKVGGKIPIYPIPRDKDKYTRVLDVQGYLEAGLVVLPKNEHWTADFVGECEAFTAQGSHKHDDQIDPMVDAITKMLTKRQSEPRIRQL